MYYIHNVFYYYYLIFLFFGKKLNNNLKIIKQIFFILDKAKLPKNILLSILSFILIDFIMLKPRWHYF